MESDKSQDLQGELADWRPKKANGIITTKSWQAQDPGRADVPV